MNHNMLNGKIDLIYGVLGGGDTGFGHRTIKIAVFSSVGYMYVKRYSKLPSLIWLHLDAIHTCINTISILPQVCNWMQFAVWLCASATIPLGHCLVWNIWV